MRLRCISQSMKKSICVYNGLGAHNEDSAILLRALNSHVDHSQYATQYISPQQIIEGDWKNTTSLLAIGGGFDLGLIKALGQAGMAQIREFVHSGGSYLGVCSGAYFACDSIKFDEGGKLEVVGERYLKFYPGQCIGPVFKGYDYNTRIGAVAAVINFKFNCDKVFQMKEIVSDTVHTRLHGLAETLSCTQLENQTQNQSNQFSQSHEKEFPVYFNGGGHFVPNENTRDNQVQVLSRYQQLPDKPIAAVKCFVGCGRAILSGVHFEYDTEDIDDGDPMVTHIIPQLKASKVYRDNMFRTMLHDLGIHVCASSGTPLCEESRL